MFTGFELSSSREDVERFLRPLAKGASIPVRVCPRKPQLSVIEPGVDRRLVVMLAVGAFLIFLGTADLAGWLK